MNSQLDSSPRDPLAQHLAVVDLADLDRAAAGGGPGAGDAALAAQVGRRLGDEQQEGVPGGRRQRAR